MSAESNKKIIEDVFARVAEGDGSLYLEKLDDDVVMRVTGTHTWAQTFNGKTELVQNLYGYLRSVTEGLSKTIPHNIIAEGDYVVVEAHGEMTTKEGKHYNNQYCLIYRMKNDKIVEIREYSDSKLCEELLGPYPDDK